MSQQNRGKTRTAEESSLLFFVNNTVNKLSSLAGVSASAGGRSDAPATLTITQQIQLAKSAALGHIAAPNAHAAVMAPVIVKAEQTPVLPDKVPSTTATVAPPMPTADSGAPTAPNSPPAETESKVLVKKEEDHSGIYDSSVASASVPIVSSTITSHAEHVPVAIAGSATDSIATSSIDSSEGASAPAVERGVDSAKEPDAAEPTAVKVEDGFAASTLKIGKRERIIPVLQDEDEEGEASVGGGAASSSQAPAASAGGHRRATARPRENRSLMLDATQFPLAHLVESEGYNTFREGKAAAQAEFAGCNGVCGKEYVLDNFGLPVQQILPGAAASSVNPLQCKQTLVMKLSVPHNSRRWCINICAPATTASSEGAGVKSADYEDILLHFNPRCQKKAMHVSDRLVYWDKKNEFKYEYSMYPWLAPLLGVDETGRSGEGGAGRTTVELMLQAYPGGWVLFLGGRFCTYFVHRGDIAQYAMRGAQGVVECGSQAAEVGGAGSLILQVPFVEEINDAPENVTVHQIWWGHRSYGTDAASLPADLLRNVLLKPVSQEVVDDRKLAAAYCLRVSGLPVVFVAEECQGLEHLLYDFFDGERIKGVYVPKGAGKGFARFEQGTDIAKLIRELNNISIKSPKDDKLYTLELTPIV